MASVVTMLDLDPRMGIDAGLVVRMSPERFTSFLALGVDAGAAKLSSVRESLEGSFVERPLRAVARDLAGALRALGLPADVPIAESHHEGEAFEVLLRGRIDHRATVDDALRALTRESERASFTIVRRPAEGSIHVRGTLDSWWAYCGWLEPLLLIMAAADVLDGSGRAAFFADGDDYAETLIADVYRIESGVFVRKRLDPPDLGEEATRAAFAEHGLVLA